MKTTQYIGSALLTAAFLFSAGSAFAQTVPNVSTTAGLTASLATAPSVPAGSSNVVLATVTLNQGNSGPASIASLPVTATFNGGTLLNYTACSVQNPAALGIPLSAPIALSNSGATTFTLMVPTIVGANTMQRLAIVCSVSPIAPAGSSITFSIDPATLPATVNGSTITPSVSGATSGTVTITPAITDNSGSVGTTPGVPNTGVGGDALATLLILALSLLAAFIGSTVTRKMKDNEALNA